MAKLCGAKTRAGTPCKRLARTSTGRCKLHGGASLKGTDHPGYKHGRYSKHLPRGIREKIEGFEDSDALDLLPELNIQRALFAEYIERLQTDGPPTAATISLLVNWSNDIGRMVERIVKMKNDSALTGAEITYIATRIADVVASYIDDPQEQRAFITDLFRGIGRSVPAGPAQLGEGSRD